MFEKYSTDNLYHCEINDMLPYYLENFCGYIAISGESNGNYKTIVYEKDGKYIDINNPSRIINIVNKSEGSLPVLSKNYHLYLLDEESLKKYQSEEKVLRRVPFMNKK